MCSCAARSEARRRQYALLKSGGGSQVPQTTGSLVTSARCWHGPLAVPSTIICLATARAEAASEQKMGCGAFGAVITTAMFTIPGPPLGGFAGQLWQPMPIGYWMTVGSP